MKCSRCGKEFEKWEQPDGLPSGVVFNFKNGGSYTLCSDCIIDGTENPKVMEDVVKAMNESGKWEDE